MVPAWVLRIIENVGTGLDGGFVHVAATDPEYCAKGKIFGVVSTLAPVVKIGVRVDRAESRYTVFAVRRGSGEVLAEVSDVMPIGLKDAFKSVYNKALEVING